MSALSQQHAQPMVNNQMNILQRVVQAQDHPSSRPLNNLLTQSATAKWQRQLLRSGGSKLSPLDWDFLKDGSLQQNLVVQPNPSAPSAGLQSSAPPSQAPPQGGQQMLSLNNIADVPLLAPYQHIQSVGVFCDLL
ncbi:hypothetical protein BGW80DRAFT_1565446 [Lactifluus volemus]|nr:hypothetical protein BGW80DRAFT_1565446 [Lactifluus volemus]